MTTSQFSRSPTGVRPEELARHIADMYRDMANAAVDDLHFHTGRVVAEAYRFASERARRTSDKYGAHTIELLAVTPEKELSR